MDLTNSPIAKLKEKKGQAHTPTISTPFIQDATPIKTPQAEPIKEEQKPQSEAPIIKPSIKKDAEPRQKKNNTTHTFIIDKDDLLLLQALSNYNNITINGILQEALKRYFATISDDNKDKALSIYKQLLTLKGK